MSRKRKYVPPAAKTFPRCECGGFWQGPPAPLAFIHSEACTEKKRSKFLAKLRKEVPT